MAKGSNKLTKLLSVLKKLNSFNNKQSRSPTSPAAVAASDIIYNEESSANLHPVYVGKSRRRYLISSDIIDNPLFRELAERSSSGENDTAVINVSCEVVLFEHLLWMLENADPQPESLEELVEFYAC
ncbi:SMALL AUXIN UPREGULATED RNA 76 [Hibiscus trionum]|uniref:SMALL AUXIN UPREGULATED RNA 76 n=1 Tax=Hibiscus trionum TaxID=183268 RepID=A0A9W7JJJ6_HIBTR|nr:SMALL AUXIN UPREGULATED RNA 76 [Hibiscus trionum]